jgi:hypothetical protein
LILWASVSSETIQAPPSAAERAPPRRTCSQPGGYGSGATQSSSTVCGLILVACLTQ